MLHTCFLLFKKEGNRVNTALHSAYSHATPEYAVFLFCQQEEETSTTEIFFGLFQGRGWSRSPGNLFKSFFAGQTSKVNGHWPEIIAQRFAIGIILKMFKTGFVEDYFLKDDP